MTFFVVVVISIVKFFAQKIYKGKFFLPHVWDHGHQYEGPKRGEYST